MAFSNGPGPGPHGPGPGPHGPGMGPGDPRFWGPGPNVHAPRPSLPGSAPWGSGPNGPPRQWGPHGPPNNWGPRGPPNNWGPRGPPNNWGPHGPPNNWGPCGPPDQWVPHGPPDQWAPRGPPGPHGQWGSCGPTGPHGLPNQWGPPSGPPGQWGPSGPNGPNSPMDPSAQWGHRQPGPSGTTDTTQMIDPSGAAGTGTLSNSNPAITPITVAPPGVDIPSQQMSMCEMADHLMGSNGEPINGRTMDTSMLPPVPVVASSNNSAPNFAQPPPLLYNVAPPAAYSAPPPTHMVPPPIMVTNTVPSYQGQPPTYQTHPSMYQNQSPMYQNQPAMYPGQSGTFQGQSVSYQEHQNYPVPCGPLPSATLPQPPVSAVVDPAVYEAATISAAPVMQPPPNSDSRVNDISSQPIDAASNTATVKLKSKAKANKIKIKSISTIPQGGEENIESKRDGSDTGVENEDDAALADFYSSVESQIAEKKKQLTMEEFENQEEKKKEEDRLRKEEEKKKARKLPSEIKGQVSIVVKNIFKSIGIYEFRRILQACGQIIRYNMKKPNGEEYASATITFSNIEEALRAARLTARLAIVDCKMTSVVPDFINNDAPPSRGMLSKDKDIVKAITKLLYSSCRTFAWDAPAKPPEDEDKEINAGGTDTGKDEANTSANWKKDSTDVKEDSGDAKQNPNEVEKSTLDDKMDDTDVKQENLNLADAQTRSADTNSDPSKADEIEDMKKKTASKTVAKKLTMSVSNIPDVAPLPPSMSGTNGLNKDDTFKEIEKNIGKSPPKRRYRKLSTSSVSSDSLDEDPESPRDHFGRAKRKRSRSVSKPGGETRSRSRSRSRDRRRSSRHRHSRSPVRGERRRRSRSYDGGPSRLPYRRRGGDGPDSRPLRHGRHSPPAYRRDDGGGRRPLPYRREDGGGEDDRHYRRDYAGVPPYGDRSSGGLRHPPPEECDRPGSRGSLHHHPAPVTIIRSASPESAGKKRASKTPSRMGKINDYNLKIIEYEKNITKSAVCEINNIFRGSKDPVYNDGWFLAIPSAERAVALHKLVHNYRLLDTKIRLTFLQKPSIKGKPKESDLKGFESRIKKVFQLYDNHTKHMFKAEVSKVLDPYLYKLEPCPDKYCNVQLCPKFHNHEDRRRDPRKVTYNPVICVNLSCVSICPRGDSCKLAHNNSEIMMHPSIFLTDVCTLWYEERICTSPSLCNNAHPESPDMFYHVAWSDLFVAGLHNTFFFIAGAIRNLLKLKQVTAYSLGVPVLVVTNSEDVATNVPTMLEAMAARHGVKICSVISGSEDPRGSHIIVGTVKGLLLMFSERGVGPLRGLNALIVDDVSVIFGEHTQLTSLVDLVVLVYNQLENPERLNKVILAHEIYDKDCSTAQELFSTEFTIVGKISEPGRDELAEVYGSPSSCPSNKTESEQSSNEEEDFPLAVSKSDKDATAKKTDVSLNSDHSDKEDWSDSSGSSDHHKSSRSSKKHMPKLRSQTLSRSSASAGNSSPCTPSKKMLEKTKSKKLKSDSDMRQITQKKNSKSLEETSYNPPELTPQQFLSEEKALRTEHEQEYSVFVEVPEMHPDYEAKYEQFITCYRKRAGGSLFDAELEEKVWSTYWFEELEKLKKDEWQEKRKNLVDKYKLVVMKKKGLKNMSSHSDVQPCSSLPSDSVLMQSLAFAKNPPNLTEDLAIVKSTNVPQSTPLPPPPQISVNLPKSATNVSADEFDIKNVFDALDGVCGRLGVLGTALKGLIGMAQEVGSNTIEAMKIFVDADNVTLIKMTIEKLKIQLKTSSQSTSAKLQKSIESAEKLLCHAEEQLKAKPVSPVKVATPLSEVVTLPQKEERALDDIDINLIAKATLGKNPAEILSFINSTLAFEGKTVNNEELTTLYLSVSALHMTLTLENSANMSSTSMPLSIPSRSQTANNILLTSMSESSGHIVPQSSYASSQPYTDTTNVIYSGATPLQAPASEWEQPTHVYMSHSPTTQPLVSEPPTQPRVSDSQAHQSPSQKVASVDKEDSWFVQQVKMALSDPGITIELFNKQLATIFAKKPRNYQFSASDLNLASELQQLGTSNFTGEVFIKTLRKILNM